MTTVPSSRLTWTNTGRANSIEYTYRIFAINLVGDSDWTSASVVTLAQAPKVPSVPIMTSVMPGPGNIKLDWGEPAFNGGAAVTSYMCRYMLSGSNTWRNCSSTTITDTEVTVEGLTPNETYDFEVQAVNSVGAGPALELEGMPQPQAPTVTITTLGAVVSNTDTDDEDEITLTWTELDATDEAITGGENMLGYELEWKTSEGDDDDWAATTETQSDSGSTAYPHPRRPCSRYGLPVPNSRLQR